MDVIGEEIQQLVCRTNEYPELFAERYPTYLIRPFLVPQTLLQTLD